jgi:hypothetical protein
MADRYALNWQAATDIDHTQGLRQLIGAPDDAGAAAIATALDAASDATLTEITKYDHWYRPAPGGSYPLGTNNHAKVIARTADQASATYYVRNLHAGFTNSDLVGLFSLLAHPLTGDVFVDALVAESLDLTP